MSEGKRKILLVTLQDRNNFGNRLQNYALQTVLENMGYEINTPVYSENMKDYGSIFKQKAKKILLLMGQTKYLSDVRHCELDIRRRKFFDQFNEKFISGIINIDVDKMNEFDTTQYVAAITGSDQVWHNWKIIGKKELEYFYLSFIPESKRISYAASFGFSDFPERDRERHRIGLAGMKAISCREKKGCELVRQVSHKEATLVPDPTLLLDVVQWQKIIKKPEFDCKKPFILVFFLGNIEKEYSRYIKHLAYEKKLEIIDIYNFVTPRFASVGPCEFLWLLSHAEYVCTDSFHACVFSTIFHRNFTAFRRVEKYFGKMFSRIEDFLTNLNLTEAIFTDENSVGVKFDENVWQMADEARRKMTEKGIRYLKDELGE